MIQTATVIHFLAVFSFNVISWLVVANTGYNWSAPRCKPACQNGGVCIANGQCQCAPGYKGTVCQNRE